MVIGTTVGSERDWWERFGQTQKGLQIAPVLHVTVALVAEGLRGFVQKDRVVHAKYGMLVLVFVAVECVPFGGQRGMRASQQHHFVGIVHGCFAQATQMHMKIGQVCGHPALNNGLSGSLVVKDIFASFVLVKLSCDEIDVRFKPPHWMSDTDDKSSVRPVFLQRVQSNGRRDIAGSFVPSFPKRR